MIVSVNFCWFCAEGTSEKSGAHNQLLNTFFSHTSEYKVNHPIFFYIYKITIEGEKNRHGCIQKVVSAWPNYNKSNGILIGFFNTIFSHSESKAPLLS